MKKVFISSTAKDLADYRDAVHEVIRGFDEYQAVRMEDFGARASPAEEFCREKVEECDLLIGIVGLLYGSSPTDSELSFTVIEYDAAFHKQVPCLMFMAPDLVLVEPADDFVNRITIVGSQLTLTQDGVVFIFRS